MSQKHSQARPDQGVDLGGVGVSVPEPNVQLSVLVENCGSPVVCAKSVAVAGNVPVQWELKPGIVENVLENVGPCLPLFGSDASVDALRRMPAFDADYSHLDFSGFEVAFTSLKECLMTAPVLILPDTSKQFVIHTDASDYALVAVLMQHTVGGLQPVVYYSRQLMS